MSLAALIIDNEDDSSGDGSAYRVAGQKVAEYQIRCAIAAGAKHLLLYARGNAGAALGVIDALARDGVKVELVRSAAEAADHIHPDELVLLIDNGVVISPEILMTLAVPESPLLLTVPATARNEAFERIDAVTRWSGIAFLSGVLVRKTAAELGEWDFSSTALRRAVQTNIDRISVGSEVESGKIAIAHSTQDRAAYNRALIASLPDYGVGLIDRFGWSRLGRMVLPRILESNLSPLWLVWMVGAVSLTVVAVASLGSPIVALALFILSGFIETLAHNLQKLTMRGVVRLEWLVRGRNASGAVALGLMSYRLFDVESKWVCLVLSLWMVVELFRVTQFDIPALSTRSFPVWRATSDAIALILLVAFALNFGVVGIGLATCYSVLSGFALARRIHS